jgi:hypothetical protein
LSVWIDYFNGIETPETNKLDGLLGVQPVCTGDLILVEVLQGFRKDQDFQTAKTLLCSLTIHAMLGAGLSLNGIAIRTALILQQAKPAFQ